MFILNFSLILYSLLFFALFSFLGLGLTILCCPREWHKYTVFLSPLIGYCLLTLTGWFFYSLNFKGTDDYYYWVLLLAMLLLIGAVIKIWKQKFLKELFSRELVVPILIAVIIFLVIAFPALRQVELTPVTIGNADISNYSMSSKIVKELPKEDGLPHSGAYYSVQEQTLGGFINTAFFCSVAKLDPYQVQMISIFIFFIISLFLTYLLAREVFAYTSFAANIIILLYGLNSLLCNVIYHGFENQIIAISLTLCIFLSNVAVIRANKFKDAFRYVPFLFLSLWGLSLTYSHMFVIIYGLIIAYVLLSCWESRKVTKLINWTAINCIAALIIFCLSPQRPQMIISNTFNMSSVQAGWFMPWITPQKLYGIIPFLMPDAFSFNPDTLAALACSTYSLAFTTIVAVILVAVIASGFVKLYKSDRENFLFSLSTFLLIFIGALILSIQNQTRLGTGFGGYNQYKLISFFLPVLLLSSFALFKDMPFNIRSSVLRPIQTDLKYVRIKKEMIYFLIVLALVVSTCVSAAATLYETHKRVYGIPSDIVDLQNIRNNKEIKSINIPCSSGLNIMWEAYFLFPKKLFFQQPTYGDSYYIATPDNLNGEWWLIRSTGGSTGKVLSIVRKAAPNTVLINTTYSLSRSASGFTAELGKGWADDEVTHRWTTSDIASIITDAPSENMHVNLTLKYTPLNKDNSLSIYLNGVKIMDCANNSSCEIKELLLTTGENIIEFRAKLPAELPGNGDPRKLCYSFTLIQFEQTE